MESSHVMVLERLAAAASQLETLALQCCAEAPNSGDGAGAEGHSVFVFEADETGVLHVAQPPARKPPLSPEARAAIVESAMRASLGSESTWRRVCRLSEKLQRLARAADLVCDGAGVYSPWRSTAALDRVELDEGEVQRAVAQAHDDDDDSDEGDASEEPVAVDDDEEDPFGWITGGPSPHNSNNNKTAEKTGHKKRRSPSSSAQDPLISSSSNTTAAISPDLLLRRVQEEEDYAKAAAQDLLQLSRSRTRLAGPTEAVAQRMKRLVDRLDALFDGGPQGPDGLTPLQRASRWLAWEPVYTVPDSSAAEQQVWDQLVVQCRRGEREKNGRDLALLCRTNRHRLEALLGRIQRAQGEYVSLVQKENERVAHAMLQLDALEEAM